MELLPQMREEIGGYMSILAIDPGHVQSAYLIWDYKNKLIVSAGIRDNPEFLRLLREKKEFDLADKLSEPLTPVIEMIASYGMPVGKEIFETCLLIGRIVEIFAGGVNLVYRKDIKLHLCGSPRAKDSNIRQALIDRYGQPGTKKAPGLLYGVSKDIWSALAVAIFWQDIHIE